MFTRSVSPRQLWSWAEWLYASIVIFALTQGPIYQLWRESADYVSVIAEPSPRHVHFATFLLVQIPGVFLFARRMPATWFSARPIQLLAAFLGWLILSSGASSFARQSIPEVVALLATTGFGLYLVVSFSVRSVLWQLLVAMTAGLGLSYLAVVRLWDGARNQLDDYWIGIYLNRNSLAPVAAVGVISAVLLFCVHRNSARAMLLRRATSLLVVLSGAAMLYQSESITSVGSLVITFVVVVFWLVMNRIAINRWRVGAQRRLLAITILGASVIVGVGLVVVVRTPTLLDRTDAFSSRAPLWSLNWTGFLERPFLGWGWMAAWDVPDFRKQGEWWVVSWDNAWAHSGYFDLLLGGGIVAVALFVTWVLVSCSHRVRLPGQNQSSVSIIAPVAVSIFVLAAATQESFFIGSHFLWALLVWGLTSTALAADVNQPAGSPQVGATNVEQAPTHH